MTAAITSAAARSAILALVVAMFALGDATATPPPQFELDPHAGSWLHGPDLPAPRQASASAVLGGRIYVIGGFGSDSEPTDTTYVLEPAVGTDLSPSLDKTPVPLLPVGSWTTARPIPEAVDHAAAASLDGYLYVVGGTIEKKVTNKFWRYDPIDDKWAALPPLPIPRWDPTMQAFNGKLYVIGGSSSGGDDETGIEVFDPADLTWTVIVRALGTEREESRTVIFGDKIAIVGGRDRQEHNQVSCDLYDPVHDAWSVCSDMHMGRSGFGLASVGDQMFAIGGVNQLTGITTQTTEISGHGGDGWMDGRWLPAPSQEMSVAVIGHIVWVIGGSNWDATAPTATVLRYVIPLVKVRFAGRPHP
jgi:N-acetylneuraminic acid mutarotase